MTNKTLIAAIVAISAGLVAQAGTAKPGSGMRNMPSFEELDTNGDGALTEAELAAHRAARFAAMDSDGDGKLTAAELEAHRSAKMAEKLSKRSARMIERLDADGDGALSAAEMTKMRNSNKMFERVDKDGNGAISAEEFEAARAKMEKRMKHHRHHGSDAAARRRLTDRRSLFRKVFSKERASDARSTVAPATERPRQDPDAELLLRYAQGDAAAASALTQRLGPMAFGVAFRVLGDRAEAEDVAQEALLRLWKAAPDWDQRREDEDREDEGRGTAKVSTWLYRVVMNLSIDVKRRRRGGSVDLDAIPEPADDSRSAADIMQDGARQEALQAALMQLPERQRRAVILRHIEGLGNPEIAEILDVSVEAVESLTARGKRALAKLLVTRKAELGYHDG